MKRKQTIVIPNNASPATRVQREEVRDVTASLDCKGFVSRLSLPSFSSSLRILLIAGQRELFPAVAHGPFADACGADCAEAYPQGASVTLTATPSPGSTFTGWSGGCSGTGTCTVIMNSAVTANAAFDLAPCTYTLAPVSKSFPANGGTVTVTITGKGQKTCPLPAVTSPVPWLTITPPAVWKNNRGTAKIAAPVTTQSTSRSATVTIGGTFFPVTQAGLACAVKKLTLTPPSYPKTGGSGTVTVQAAPQDCAWSATASKTWTDLLENTGTGNGVVTFTADYNPTTVTRTGTISVILAQPPNRKGNVTVRQTGR